MRRGFFEPDENAITFRQPVNGRHTNIAEGLLLLVPPWPAWVGCPQKFDGQLVPPICGIGRFVDCCVVGWLSSGPALLTC